MTRALTAILALSAALGIAPGVLAHHGWSGYDSSQTLELTGVIKDSGYEHPHGYIDFEVPGKTWVVVLAPPSRMERRGLPREMLKAGTKVTVVGYPSKTDPREMRAERIIIEDKTVELR